MTSLKSQMMIIMGFYESDACLKQMLYIISAFAIYWGLFCFPMLKKHNSENKVKW